MIVGKHLEASFSLKQHRKKHSAVDEEEIVLPQLRRCSTYGTFKEKEELTDMQYLAFKDGFDAANEYNTLLSLTQTIAENKCPPTPKRWISFYRAPQLSPNGSTRKFNYQWPAFLINITSYLCKILQDAADYIQGTLVNFVQVLEIKSEL